MKQRVRQLGDMRTWRYGRGALQVVQAERRGAFPASFELADFDELRPRGA